VTCRSVATRTRGTATSVEGERTRRLMVEKKARNRILSPADPGGGVRDVTKRARGGYRANERVLEPDGTGQSRLSRETCRAACEVWRPDREKDGKKTLGYQRVFSARVMNRIVAFDFAIHRQIFLHRIR
jgi:hypothetical protein